MVSSVFGVAPRALAGVINLQQTVDLVRLSIEVVEANIEELLDPADAADIGAAVLRYAREVAFATAEVYARAAEVRGAWDARLEALVVDAVLRSDPDEALLSRASALGWAGRGDVAVVLGSATAQRRESESFEEVRRAARAGGMDALCAVQGDRLVIVLGGVGDPRAGRRRRRRPVRTRARSWSGRSPTTWARRTSRRGRRWPPTAPPRVAGGAPAGAQRRPAPRACAGGRRPRPAPPGRGDLPARC